MTKAKKQKTASAKVHTLVSENPLGRPYEFEGFPDKKTTSYLLDAMFREPRDASCALGVGRHGGNPYGTWGYMNIWQNNGYVVKGYTLEPRANVGKGPIPIGKYYFNRWMSPHLGKTLRLYNVPGFTDVLIHVGNTQTDTQGCILAAYSVDNTTTPTRLVNSRPFVDWLYDNYASGHVWIVS